jgi:hypothetical protein
VREAALQLAEDIGREVPEALVVQGSQLLAGVVALFVKVGAGWEVGGYVWTGRSAWRRHGLLPPNQFVVYICRQFVELGWG